MTQNVQSDQNNPWCLVPKQQETTNPTPVFYKQVDLQKIYSIVDLAHKIKAKAWKPQYLFMSRFWINQYYTPEV